jgi:hypothetical protein
MFAYSPAFVLFLSLTDETVLAKTEGVVIVVDVTIGVLHGMSKMVEDGRRSPAL